MKIVIITPRVPGILDKGDKLRIFYQIKYLSDTNDIHLISLSSSKKTKINKELKKYIKSFHLIHTSKINRLFNLIYHSIINKLPIQISYYYSKKNHKKINKIIDFIKPDFIYCQLIRTAEFIKKRNEKKLIDYMDCFSLGLIRRSEKSNFLMKLVILFEYKRVKEYETNIFNYFKNHTIISKYDRDYIDHLNKKSICVIENGIETNYFKRKNDIYKKNTIIFVGNMSYRPNVLAAKFICEEIFPLVLKKEKNTRVIIAGSNPNKEVRKLSKLNKKIKITGFIEDIRDAYEEGTVFIAPMFIGSGLQNKLLEAMSMKIPCITTKTANKSLNASEKEILIAKDKDEFANYCIELFNNKEKNLNLIKNGFKFVKTKFNWKKSTDKLNKIFRQ